MLLAVVVLVGQMLAPGCVVGNTYWKGMWGRMLDLVGAENIAANHIPGAWGSPNPEYLLAARPDASPSPDRDPSGHAVPASLSS